MNFNFDEKSQLTNLDIDSSDVCAQCFPEIRNVCPLLACFITNNIYPCAETLQLTACCLYEYVKEQREQEKGNKTS